MLRCQAENQRTAETAAAAAVVTVADSRDSRPFGYPMRTPWVCNENTYRTGGERDGLVNQFMLHMVLAGAVSVTHPLQIGDGPMRWAWLCPSCMTTWYTDKPPAMCPRCRAGVVMLFVGGKRKVSHAKGRDDGRAPGGPPGGDGSR